MKIIGNILWVIFEGLWIALGWLLGGLLLCLTVIGIPFGIQCFKIAGFVLFPFGKEISYGSGTGSFLLNLIWIVFGGLGLAASSLILGLAWCVTIIGIPFGIQSIKLAKLSLMPFGAKIE